MSGRRTRGRLKVAWVAFALALLGGCIPDPDPDPSGDGGRVCYSDSDCAPSACCGAGSSAVHVLDAPSCSAVTCDGGCPRNSVSCGCGLAVCKDNHCAVARTVSPSCP